MEYYELSNLQDRAIDQPAPAEQVMVDNPPPAVVNYLPAAINGEYLPPAQANPPPSPFPNIDNIFFDAVGSSQANIPPLPCLNGYQNNFMPMIPTPNFHSPEQMKYVPMDLWYSPQMVINHLIETLAKKDKQLNDQYFELVEKSKMLRTLTGQLYEAMDENVRLRGKLLNVNPEAMTFLEDYPPEVNAHLTPGHPRSG